MKSISTITLTESDYIIPNSFYADTDGDGVDDYLEDLNADGNLDNDDTDADGIANYLDVDDDNDTIPTFREQLLGDTDNDGTPNYLDTDDDNDQWLTAAEGQADDDNDGVPNHLDNTHYANPVNGPLTHQNYENHIGDKAYELSNHLGNVLSVISDKKILAFGTQIVQVHEGITGFEADGNEVSLATVDNGNSLQCATSFNNTGTFFKQTLQANTEYIISIDINKDTYDADIKVVVEDDATGNIYHTNTITQSGYNFFTFTAPETATYKIRYLKQHQNVGDESIQAFYIKKFFIFTLEETQTVDGFLADVLSYNDYYPFGMLLPERHASDESYRYGFQGSEKDDELKGEGNSYTTFFRQYDPRIGKWLTHEPKPVAWESPFAYSRNNPIIYNDPLGDCPDGNCSETNLVQANKIATTAMNNYGDNIIGWGHNKDVVDKVYNHIANVVAKKYEISVDNIPNNVSANTFLNLTVSIAMDRILLKLTDRKKYEELEIAIGNEGRIGFQADLIIDRHIEAYQNKEEWDFTLLVIQAAAIAEGPIGLGHGPNTARVLTKMRMYTPRLLDRLARLKNLRDLASNMRFIYTHGGQTYVYYGKTQVGWIHGANNTLNIEINLPKSLQGKGIGSMIFRDAVRGEGEITALWIKGDIYAEIGGVSLNLSQYKAGIANGMTSEAAAWNTWTGQQAINNGFNHVIVKEVENGIQAIFTKR